MAFAALEQPPWERLGERCSVAAVRAALHWSE